MSIAWPTKAPCYVRTPTGVAEIHTSAAWIRLKNGGGYVTPAEYCHDRNSGFAGYWFDIVEHPGTRVPIGSLWASWDAAYYLGDTTSGTDSWIIIAREDAVNTDWLIAEQHSSQS